jgi:hypothetical protein
MTENFPYLEAKAKMGARLDLSTITALVEKGTPPVELDSLFIALEDLFFTIDRTNPANIIDTLKEENLKDDDARGEAVEIIKKIHDRINELKRQYSRARFSKVTPAGVGAANKQEFDEAVNILESLLNTYAEKIENYLNDAEKGALGIGASLERLKDSGEMTLPEIVDEISTIVNFKDDRAVLIENEFLKKIGAEKDIQKVAWYRTRRALQNILGAGDTGLVAFDVWFNAIIEQLANKTTSFLRLARGLFLVRPEKVGNVESEDYKEVEINDRALQVYEYVVKRIKHQPEFGGLPRDPEGSAFDKTDSKGFGYMYLKDDVAEQFVKHLEAKFDDLDPKLLAELIKYAQAMAAKSAGFIPWLLHETTRQHGLTIPSQNPDAAFKDELFVTAPFAAGHYSRNRYGQNFPNSTSEEMLYLPKPLLNRLSVKQFEIEEAEYRVAHKTDQKGNSLSAEELKRAQDDLDVAKEKIHQSERLWDIVDLFRRTLWLQIPPWVKDPREMMVIGLTERADLNDPKSPLVNKVIRHDGSPALDENGNFRGKVLGKEIDLNSSIFPMPGEVVINILRVEQEKRSLNTQLEHLGAGITRLNDKFREKNEERDNIQTRIGDIDTLIPSLDPVADAVQIADLTNEKNDLITRLTDLDRIIELINDKLEENASQRRALLEKIQEFTDTYSKQGYGDTYDQIGVDKLSQIKQDDYIPLAFDAFKNMNEVFRTEPKVMNEEEILTEYKKWQDKWVGKAKLVPGKHHMLFGPFTMRFIHRLFSQYEDRENQDLVNELRREIIKHLKGAKGLPWYVRDYVEENLSWDKTIKTLTRSYRAGTEAVYHGKLWQFQTEHPEGWERKFAAALPFGWGKRNKQGGPMETVAPWFWDKLDEDTRH